MAVFAGTGCPVTPHTGLETVVFSPKSVRAMMSRVFDVVPDLFVTQTSTRLIFIPVVRFGSVFMAASYLLLKYCERKKCRFSS